MTSAVNHRPRLNGNKAAFWCCSFLVLVLLVAGCKTQRAPVEDTADKDTEKEEPVRIPIDTIQWSVLSPEDFPPVGYPEDSPYRDRIPETIPPPILKEKYRIALFLSMEEWPETEIWEIFLEEEDLEDEELEEIEELIPTLNEDALEFLNGFEYALKRELAEGVQIVVEVHAIGERRPRDEILSRLSELNFTADLMIGGRTRAELEALSAFAAANDAVLLNPWFPGNFEVAPDAQVVSLQPGLRDHFDLVARKLGQMEEDDAFYVVYSPREESRVEEFRRIFHEYFPDREFGELFFRDDVEILEFEFDEFFDEESTTWFFLPMTRNHPFIYPVLRTLDARSEDKEYKVLGLTLWDRDVHQELQAKIDLYNTSAHSPIFGDSILINFNQGFYDYMGYIGSTNEYEGFITGEFARRNLLVYGADFPLYLPYSDASPGYFNFRFREYGLEEKAVEEFGRIPSNLRNKGLYLLRFDEGKFRVLID